MLYIPLRFLSWVLFKAVCGLEVSGCEFIPKKGGFILASNHLSYLDPIAVGVACGRLDLNYMARHNLFRNPGFAWVLKEVHVFPVKRNTADFKALKEAMRRVNQKKGLVLFPEGTRQVSGKFGEPEPGIGFLAAKLRVPVIPVLVRGTDQAWPKKARLPRPAKVKVTFGPGIAIDSKMSYDEVAQKIMAGIKNLA
ncbi:MAG: lysophospholipid acyltransferase family protein [Candidatus Omnitrophota bacterium]|nr:1-acyl-sn-glycerol-3-phosphate acyltransferase [Candidatus Omnitrophota bacterium]MBU1929677.1 1-acyl-sn-glycerol-3-phosphate acyltransferase [Candidatus Omnitrophota bacterium]MBU2034651.1 1-acyl-sn-glycerol-3-phosphate acyltransferase [Candidatus Omnitrophota bacterium]MBU2222056.1 1-acyl-sn-glycerol-3-phosphate acyltransferase [Candidatus Omnitrophota bacterium]